MRPRILRGMSFAALAVLLGVYLAHAQNPGGIQANFAPLTPQNKVDARSTPAKVTSEEEYALISKGYVLLGWVSASQPGKKTDAAVIKQLESAILQKGAEAGGDVVRFVKEGALETTWVPTGKTKTSRTCDQTGERWEDHGAGNQRGWFEYCVRWGEPITVPITRKEEDLVSMGAVWRYDSEQASVMMHAHSNITNAASAGDLNRVQALLKDHPELISSKDASGDTPLHAAIRAKAGKNLVDLLLASNADVNARDANGETPLHFATILGDQSLVQQLLDHKADINARKNNGDTILQVTACQGNLQMAEFLLANKADINIRDAGGNTPLHCAAIGGHLEMVRVLLTHKADVNAGNREGYTPLAYIKFVTKLKTKQFKEIAEILRQAGGGMVPDTGAKEIAEASAMPSQSGVGQGQSAGDAETHEAAELPPESAGGKSQSPGQTGAAVNDADAKLKCIALLSAEPRDKDSGQTPLHAAAAMGCKDEMKLLLAKGAEVNAEDHDGFTPLHLAGRADVAELLLANGAKVNARSKDGLTPLHSAAENGQKGVAELLLATGADVNAKDKHGYAPLFWAYYKGHKDVALLLALHGAHK